MAERALDASLNYLDVNLEEKRVLKILLMLGKPAGADQIKREYEKSFNVKIGSKIYHILGNLESKGYVSTSKGKQKLFHCNNGKIAARIGKALEKEQEKIQETMDKIKFLEGKPSLTTHVGSKSVAELFLKIIDKLKEGCEMHTIKDTMHYPIRSGDPIDRKAFLEEERKLMRIVNKNRRSGKLVEYYITEKSRCEKAVKNLAKEFGKEYVKETLAELVKLLDLKNFNAIFGKDLEFKFFVIPDYCAVTAWFSSPRQYSLDRAIAFWYPDDIKGLDEYFWSEWRGILNGRIEEEAKEEVKKWARKLLDKI